MTELAAQSRRDVGSAPRTNALMSRAEALRRGARREGGIRATDAAESRNDLDRIRAAHDQNLPLRVPPPLRASARDNPRAFTLLELLVVMSIILVLLGLLVAGMKQWNASANGATTKLRLELLNGALANLDAGGHNQFLTQWFIPQSSTADLGLNAADFGNMTESAEGSTELFTITNPSGSSTVYNSRKAAIAYMTFAPGTFLAGTYPIPPTGSGWFWKNGPVSPTTLFGANYYGIMTQLATLPSNAKSFAGLPGAAVAAATGLNSYYPSAPPPSLVNPNPPSVILDGWGNPILFCPGSELILIGGVQQPCGGLNEVYLNVKNNTAIDATIIAPDGRPFWVSAGPDGDVARGDDNLYSFNPQ